jgi:hypothetical protein
MEDVIAAFMTVPLMLDSDSELVPSPGTAWSRETGSATEDKTIAISPTLKAEFTAPSRLVCEVSGKTGKTKYLVRLQPSAPGSCVVHGSSHGMNGVAFNRALVRFRTAMRQPEFASWLETARGAFEETMPAHLAGLTQGEAP